MKKPIIGIIARPNKLANEKIFYGTYENYLKKVIQNKGLPIIIAPYQLNKKDLIKLLELCDGLIEPGGDDPEEYDLFIDKYALSHDIPVLGICLGFQVMAINDGAKLKEVDNHYLTNHLVKINDGTILKKIYQKNFIMTNSRHHFKINKVNKCLASATYNNVVEAIERSDKCFYIGVQWHPEDLKDNALFKSFIEKCIKN